MPVLIWAVFIVGAIASRYFFGTQGRLAYAAVVLVAILLFRRQLTIGLTHLASRWGLLKATIDKMPTSIRLAPANAMDELAKPPAAELSAAGFIDAGAWNIPPMPKIRLALMVHPGENLLAAIETASSIGAQVNIHTLYADGSVATYTNSRLPAPKAQRPEQKFVRMPDTAPAALFSRARNERRRDGIRAVNAQDAPNIYERLYADSINYRKAHGA
jgi:hypothetical protein